MSLFDGMLGNTLELTPEAYEDLAARFLIPGEELLKGYRIVRDLFIFTTKRIMIINYQGFTGKRTEYLMIPYRSITRYVLETPGNLDVEYTLKLYLIGSLEPVERQFRNTIDPYELEALISRFVLE